MRNAVALVSVIVIAACLALGLFLEPMAGVVFFFCAILVIVVVIAADRRL